MEIVFSENGLVPFDEESIFQALFSPYATLFTVFRIPINCTLTDLQQRNAN